ncbi:MAG: type IV-A pilus assembly ATPase PilB [Methylovulum sp.]|nr:type IV-A pilus assembly ATPase PilB [Methylovulum sp.]
MASIPTDFQASGLIKLLIQESFLNVADAQVYVKEAKQNKVPLISYLVSNKLIDSKALASKASVEFGFPFFDLDAIDCRTLPISLINEKLIRKHHVLPLFTRGKTLFIAVSDPTNHQAVEDIKFQSLLRPEIILVEEGKLGKAIEVALEANDTSMIDLLDSDLDNLNVEGAGDEDAVDIKPESDEAPIVRFVNKILLDAIKKGVSDIHMEPYEKIFRIRYRGDGMLYVVATPPSNVSTRIISRVKVMSRMDIAERRVPQDGRIKMILSKNRAIDFRVNTCPTLFGEKVVLRILDPTSAQLGIEKLGFEPDQQELFLKAINKPYGLVLVTGPTGSGKTVSLYTGLNILNSIDRNISTAEDPVEITVEGINQVNVNVKAGLTFATALRAFLRQDPDVIMVGEIRDLETADIAVKAAQTGHLVLSTLHTNDAPQTLNRLMQMGVAPFNIVSAVNLIMAQRLARRLCQYCKKEAHFPENILLSAGFKKEELETLGIFQPNTDGCEHCNQGYKGRVGIYQVMTLSEAMRTMILEGGNALQLTALAKAEGINDLRASGLNKVRQGITSLEEIDRVTKE